MTDWGRAGAQRLRSRILREIDRRISRRASGVFRIPLRSEKQWKNVVASEGAPVDPIPLRAGPEVVDIEP